MPDNLPPNSPYRSTFVGRESELRQLQAAFDAAVVGQGSVVAVLGEPGIGKTALCEQVAAYADRFGARTLVGHCYAAGSLAVPYLPFVEVLRTHVLEVDADELRTQLGDGAADVARIVPEVGRRLLVADPAPGDPNTQRWRLFRAVSDFLRAISQTQPLLLILEDLNDADRGTLDLLVHVSRNLLGARFVVLGTYRDIEVARSHPLSGSLAELRRSSTFLRLPLRGLSEQEVERMLASISQQVIPHAFVELVHRQTEGNPLFVQELLRYVVEQGLVESREGTLRRVGDIRLVERIPEGLRDVIGQRLSRLSERTNQVLAVASVLGREFRADALLRVSELPEEEVVSALEEAARVALVQEQPSAGGSTVVDAGAGVCARA